MMSTTLRLFEFQINCDCSRRRISTLHICILLKRVTLCTHIVVDVSNPSPFDISISLLTKVYYTKVYGINNKFIAVSNRDLLSRGE
jgi:hypothetical protein